MPLQCETLQKEVTYFNKRMFLGIFIRTLEHRIRAMSFTLLPIGVVFFGRKVLESLAEHNEQELTLEE